MIYTIARYEDMGGDQFLVGFNLGDDNGNSAYVESVLQKSDISGKTQEEICQLAYDNVKTTINNIKSDFESRQESIVGRVFVPTEN
jgi:hypothetical protein